MTERPLRGYQSEAVEAIEASWESGKRAPLLVMATGLGKTRTFSEVLRRRKSEGRALVLAHREELLAQASGAIAADAGLSVDLERAEDRAQVNSLFGSDVVVASVQTLREARRQRWPRDAFATVVIDEAHHAAARTYREIIDHFSGARVLGVTATPDRGDAVGLGAIFDSVAYRYELREAIDDGWLCPIVARQIECADLDISDVKATRGDLSEGELQQAMTVDAVLHQIASPLVREAGDRPTLVFCVGVDQAKALAGALSGYTKAGVEEINGGTPREKRAEILDMYQDGRVQFLVNCMVLTEGFDAPHTSCIAMARPTKSRALYAQCIGRGTRKAEGKADCLVLDFVGNSGRHTLITPLDVLAGKPLPSEVEKIAKVLAKRGVPLADAISQAEDAVRQRLEREEAERRRRHVQAHVAYKKRAVDPFATLGIATGGSGPRATDEQLLLLQRWGVDVEALKTPSRKEASQLIGRMIERRKVGLCTYKQAALLARNGLRDDLSFDDAKRAIDGLASNRWRVTADIWEAYGRRDAAE